MHKNHVHLLLTLKDLFIAYIPRPQLCNNFKIYKAKLSMYTYIYILKFFSNFQWKCPAWTCYYHQDPECLTNTFKDLTIISVYMLSPCFV